MASRADNETSSPFSEDVSTWLQSIVNYVQDTQVKRLDFRTLPVDSFQSVGANIQPVLNALVSSAVTELHMPGVDLAEKVDENCKMLTKTKIEKLNLCLYPRDFNVDNILSLGAVLKDTRITHLNISNSDCVLVYDQANDFFTHVVFSRLACLKMSMLCFIPLERVTLFSGSALRLQMDISQAQLTCLDISHVFRREKYFNMQTPEEHAELLNRVISDLVSAGLTDLNLGWNDIGDSCASAIGNLLENSKLERLNLTANFISDSGIDVLVPGLVSSKLSHLNLSRNSINGDNSLGHSLKDTKIKELDLSGNPFTDGSIFSEPNFLQGSTVAVLKLGNRRLALCERTVTLSCEHMSNFRFSELTCLDVSSNRLGREHISVLADVLSHSNITHLNLFENELSEECYDILGDCLATSALKYIDLSKTAHSHESVRGIASFVDKIRGSGLVSVDLLFNKLRSVLSVIAPSLANTALFELDLSHTDCKKHIPNLAEQLKFTGITALYLNSNNIGDDDAEALANCLEETEIVFLNLKRNKITSTGARAFALTFTRTKLRHLDLRANNIGDEGLESLAEHAKNACLTYLNVLWNASERILLVDRVLWENRRKLQQFADLLKETVFFTGDSTIFEFDRDFDSIDIDVFIESCLKIYKTVCEEPFILAAIEQDKRMLDLKKTKCCKFNSEYKEEEFVEDVFIEDCEHIYKVLLEQSSPIQCSTKDVSFFKKQALWLILEYFPTKFVSFLSRSIEADLEQHVSFVRKIDERGLTRIVELLLLNRPLYLLDEKQDILHPYVYILLQKYKQTICNTDIEPEGVEKIIEYFTQHGDLEYAFEVISLLNNSTVPSV